MTKKEYVLRAINHLDSDRVPFSIELTGEVIQHYGDQLMKDFYNPEVNDDFKEGRISRDEAVYLSIGNFISSCWSPWWDWDYKNMPESYKDPDDVPEVMPPIIKGDNFEKSEQKAKYLSEKYGTYNLCPIYGSHWEKAYFTRGIENFLADIGGSPEFAQELLDFIIKNNLEYLPRLAESPYYDGILLGSDWGTQHDLIMSPATWRQMIKKGEKIQYDIIKKNDKNVFVHSCGDIVKVMDDLVELGVNVLNPVQPECMDLAYLKNNYGDNICFWGGISTQQTLPNGTPEEVRRETEKIIKLMSNKGGYIVNSSQGIQIDVPYENLKALIETARYFGL